MDSVDQVLTEFITKTLMKSQYFWELFEQFGPEFLVGLNQLRHDFSSFFRGEN